MSGAQLGQRLVAGAFEAGLLIGVEGGLELVVEVLTERDVLSVMTGQHFEMLAEAA